MKLGSLFSGIGLFDLGLENVGFETIWQVEIDKHARQVLGRHWPNVPKYEDIRAIDWSEVERPDVLAGGFPCQPFSAAGLRKGQSDERYLWPEFYRAICSLRPRIVIVENVSALLGSPEWGTVLRDLAEAGYDAKWACIRASDVGAPHRRERIFVVAYANGQRQPSSNLERRVGASNEPPSHGHETSADTESLTGRISYGDRQVASHSDSSGLQGRERETRQPSTCVQWGVYEPAIRRWERLTRSAPRPTDDRGRLEPRFVEWMMGAPEGWAGYQPCAEHVELPKPGCQRCKAAKQGTSRTAALKGLGNGVVVQVSEEVGKWALECAA